MNYNNVLKAIEMITSPEGLGMSPKRIMVSTSGVPKMIKNWQMTTSNSNWQFLCTPQLMKSESCPLVPIFLLDLRESLEYWYRKPKAKSPTNM
jgi:23S rRNA (adenine2503-C2)-methyltransferase